MCSGGFFSFPPTAMLTLFVKTPTATRVVEAEDNATVATVKSMLSSVEGVPSSYMHCVSGGIPMSDEELVADFNSAEVTVTFALDGGAKGKKKKKNYTTPKHVPHKRKKVKLAILKYYRIEENSITATRISCIRPSCGKGVFLAAHADRAHCGKCGTTLRKVEN
eukprot:Gregarina_sp_Poly_1__4301@NODE_2338_length_2260_cov_422_540356_g1494_i0_p2_GENE_NODE_2338_length_2260_cov_422_540356_g1494_i0NODE_2338_length_2260_cov_422_540356_g1494_i0_p2_ORF_typecomplete_len164_score17_41Ribosomal_S27/PF01599_19/6_8e17ubiquitin/PF00240_23/0_00015ubiquitin/PF00240_23/7_8e03IBR/PF01485_21/0_0035Ubiquitin_2/PF14560_6/0_19Ubiquitin_2/PF14560_6/1_8e04zfNADHPPase/PF09297_11/2_3e03zfNADHPPase/PF09297_11/1_4e03zfNADHPPase/PF09297_11/0_27_NODE_2338_length_2260_cov_422_540356_g1494_i0